MFVVRTDSMVVGNNFGTHMMADKAADKPAARGADNSEGHIRGGPSTIAPPLNRAGQTN